MLRSLALLLSALVLAACGGQAESRPGSDGVAEAEVTGAEAAGPEPTEEPAAATEPALRVVATVAPLTDLVARVGGERVDAHSLVPPGIDAHTYEPRPGDVRLLADADAYIGIGLGLNEAARQLAERNLPSGAPVLLLGETALDADALVRGHTHGDDGHADDGHTHGDDGHAEDGHTHGGADVAANPHVWTSVRNAALLVDAIARELTALDPDGAGTYEANAARLRGELEDLDERISAAMATIPPEHRTLLTYHDAWAYLARDHGLEVVTAVQPGDHSEPSAAEVRAAIDLIREHDVPALFGSEVFPNRVLQTIADETGATYVADLADDVLPGRPGEPEHSYLELMRRNAVAIVEGLGGDASPLE